MPVQYSYTSTHPMGRTACTEPQCLYNRAIPLLPLCTVRPVQNLSACTVQLYLYSPYGPYGLYIASVPVQYSYTSTPPMGRTACIEPQCLYSTAIPLLPLWAVRPVHNLSACTVQLYLYPLYRPHRACNGITLPFITYQECALVELGIQHEMRMSRIVICELPGCAIFFHISHKWHDFIKKKVI